MREGGKAGGRKGGRGSRVTVRRLPGRLAAGFTLIEVVVVLVLLGIVAGVTVPALRDWAPQDALSVASDQVVRVLRSARAEALHRGVETRLMIDPDQGGYRLEIDSTGAPPVVHEGRFRLPEGTQLRGNSVRALYRFTATGMARGDSLWLSSQEGSRLVIVDSWTGEARVQ